MHQLFLTQTIDLAKNNVNQQGGPFAALVVKDNQIIATGVNSVTANLDPTAHAEISAIRAACQIAGHFQLSEYTLYTSCEPCPMCLGAIYWANLKAVYFACNRLDAATAGFADEFIYTEIAKPCTERHIAMHYIALENALAPFDAWQLASEKTLY